MIQAIIDIGSNSIRLAIYKIDESKEIKLLMNKKEIARLAAYVVNGIMTTEGIDKACYILSEFKNLLDNLQINNVISFATAAIRNARNSDEVVRCIENNTGLKIIVLSGKEEAGLGFLGAIKDIKNDIPTMTFTTNPDGQLASLSTLVFMGYMSKTNYFPDYEVRSRLPLQIMARIFTDAYSVRTGFAKQ